MPIDDELKGRLIEAFRRTLDPLTQAEVRARWINDYQGAVERLGLQPMDYQLLYDHMQPLLPLLCEPSDAQKERLVQGFGRLLEPGALEAFMQTWPQDPEEAMRQINIDRSDFTAFRRYLESFEMQFDPRPFMWGPVALGDLGDPLIRPRPDIGPG